MSALYGINTFVRDALPALFQSRSIQVVGASDAFIQLATLGVLKSTKHRVVIVVPTAKEISAWTEFLELSLAQFGSDRPLPALLPFFSSYGSDRYVNPGLARRQRLYALSRLADPDLRTVVVTTLQGLSQKTLPPTELKSSSIGLEVNTEHDLDDLVSRLEDLGFHKTAAVEEEGSFALRGGILDVFAPNLELPARLEFLGDELVSIRTFNPLDQKSTGSLTRVTICSAAECLIPAPQSRIGQETRKSLQQKLFSNLLEQDIPQHDRDGLMHSFESGVRASGLEMFAPLMRNQGATGFDYLTKDDVLIFPKTIESCAVALGEFNAELAKDYRTDVAQHRPVLPVQQHFADSATLLKSLHEWHQLAIEFGNPHANQDRAFFRIEGRTALDGAPVYHKDPPADLFDRWIEIIRRRLAGEEGCVAVLVHNEEQLERINNLLGHRDITAVVDRDIVANILAGTLSPGKVHIGFGAIAAHLWLPENSLLIIPEAALFGAKRRKTRSPSAKLQNLLSSFKDLKVHDLVVHVQHGIGRYMGMATLAVGGQTAEFLIIEYAANDKIYLPVDRLGLLQRYSSGSEGGGTGSLDRLGGPAWDKRKSKVKGAIIDMAKDLLRLQAQRQISDGHRYSPPNDEYFKFEAEFPYEETDDQLKAIHDVFEDLSSARPMDRLVCGDVGFGKTEVALRASLRAVLEGFQVLVLVPTTVLCHQHYRTFADRLGRHGVKVGEVNRFVDAATTRDITAGLEKGQIDIVIGTHRLLSKDIKPKRLGLLIIDEEQRFGVGHKEKLKELRANADVLTLTATPIPRTLHMAMLGLRDISIIATPPHDRLAVKTYVARFDETLIRDAIEREVARGGQVFFVHNRVEDIEEMRNFIKSLVPSVDVRTAHGQMREHQLERVIVDFLEQKFPVLVCTTIIESGIDMPNVNTLFVNRADRFGLAQLYQIRGRVGRSTQQAFAYFLTPAEEALSDDSKHRLDVLSAHQELGAGFQIASHDLELRGAGNLLGGEQSGHVAEVGLELYTEMLEAAINEVRGEVVREKVDTEIKLPITALIPSGYIKSENQRLHLYKSLFSVQSEEELVDLRKDTIDRFGPLPPELGRLFRVAQLKLLLRMTGATLLSTSAKGFYEVRFGTLSAKQIDTILGVVQKQPTKYRLSPDYKLFMYGEVKPTPSPSEQDTMLTTLIGLVQPLAQQIAAT